VRSILRIALGIIAALGGFLDIGDIVFTTQAGALYRYDLLWRWRWERLESPSTRRCVAGWRRSPAARSSM
jgi:hypothetical protein